jgi:LysM repeat protein
MEIHLIVDDDDMQLPVLPESFEVSSSQNNETVNVHSVGEVNLLGQSNLDTIEIKSEFPSSERSYADTNFNDPWDYVKTLRSWKEGRKTPVLQVTSTDIDWNVSIDTFTYGESDALGDINYTLSLKRYKAPAGRITKETKTTNYTVKKGDTLSAIAYKYLGATKYRDTIYEQNKAVIEAAFKKHQKSLRKAGKPQVKSKTSKKGKYLYKGTKLKIVQQVI